MLLVNKFENCVNSFINSSSSLSDGISLLYKLINDNIALIIFSKLFFFTNTFKEVNNFSFSSFFIFFFK